MKAKLQEGVRRRPESPRRPVVAAVALLLALLAGPGDQPRATARVIAGLAAVRPLPRERLPRFSLFGWVGPPRESTTAGRYAELAGAGFNVTVLAWADSGFREDNLARLAFTRSFGVRSLLLDRRLQRAIDDSVAAASVVDSVVRDYEDDPAFLGWYLGDEPTFKDIERLAPLARLLRERDPLHPIWNNLNGRGAFPSASAYRDYVEHYVAALHPSVLCADQYEFLDAGDRLQLAETIATLASVARANGLPFWGIVLLTRHGDYREVTEGMLRWQVAQWLAWGAHGIGYFTYWTPPPAPNFDWGPGMIAWGDGARTPSFELVRKLNVRLAMAGDWLAGLQWLGTSYSGSVPPGGTGFSPGAPIVSVDGRATIGMFADSLGTPYALVANADSLSARTVSLGLDAGRSAWQLRDDGSGWDAAPLTGSGRVALSLAAGDFALLRFSGRLDSLEAGRPPRLLVSPNPARGVVRFTVLESAGPAALEVLDLGGRRVWGHTLAPGAGTITWHGLRDVGGAVPPGVYFARIEDGRGVNVRRFSWLGE